MNIKHCYDVENLPFYEIAITHRKTRLDEKKYFLFITIHYFLSKYIECLHTQQAMHLLDYP